MQSSIFTYPSRCLRHLYEWTVQWANSKQAISALFIIALIESSFFPIPPDVLLIAIVTIKPSRWITAASSCSIGSLIGAALGYGIGFGLMTTVGQPIIDFYGASEHWDSFVALANSWGIWVLAAAAFTPIPFKVATIASGATSMSFVPFLVVSLLGRTGRFFLVAAILRLAGDRVRQILEKNLNLVSLLFFLLLIGGFLVLGLI